MKLPKPRYDSEGSLEQSLLQRRSVRSYAEQAMTLPEVSQLLWAAQGIPTPEASGRLRRRELSILWKYMCWSATFKVCRLVSTGMNQTDINWLRLWMVTGETG